MLKKPPKLAAVVGTGYCFTKLLFGFSLLLRGENRHWPSHEATPPAKKKLVETLSTWWLGGKDLVLSGEEWGESRGFVGAFVGFVGFCW